jgi:outer membrane protein with beta-barrel domain
MINTTKKTLEGFIVAALAVFAFSQAEAQVTFKPGIRAGANFSHFTKGDYQGNYYTSFYTDEFGNMVPVTTTNREEFSSKTDFYVSFYGALRLTKHYTLQPEITYSNQGSKYSGTTLSDQYNPFTPVTNVSRTLTVTYLSVAMINKFYFNQNLNIHIGPTVDFVVEKNFNVYNDVDLAFTLGAGYEFKNGLGLEARVKKGIVPVISTNSPYSDDDHTNVVFSLGATYTFNLK